MDGAVLREMDAVHVQDERRLAGPIRPEQRNALSGMDVEFDVGEGHGPVRVPEGEAARCNGWSAHRTAHATAATPQPTASSTAAPAHSQAVAAPGSAAGKTPVYPRDAMAR